MNEPILRRPLFNPAGFKPDRPASAKPVHNTALACMREERKIQGT